MGSFGIVSGLGAMVGATMKFWYGTTTSSPEEVIAASAKDSSKDEVEPVEVPALRFTMNAPPDSSSEQAKPDVPLPANLKKKKNKKKKPLSPGVADTKSVAPALAPVSSEPVLPPPVVKPPPVVRVKEALLGTKLKDMIRPPVGEEGSKILFYIDHIFTPGEVPVHLGTHLVTYKLQDADGTVSPEEHCATIKIKFDTRKLMEKMGFEKISFGYMLTKSQAHAGKSYGIHITTPFALQDPPDSLDHWAKQLDFIYEGIFPPGGPEKFSGTHVTFELSTGMNNAALYFRDGWKTARSMAPDQDKLQSVVCDKAYKAYVPTLKPALRKALQEIEAEFQADVTAGRAKYVTPGGSRA